MLRITSPASLDRFAETHAQHQATGVVATGVGGVLSPGTDASAASRAGSLSESGLVLASARSLRAVDQMVVHQIVQVQNGIFEDDHLSVPTGTRWCHFDGGIRSIVRNTQIIGYIP